tara:strand:+ start:90 stop:1049 length:960 start_codon:yes stop_codon:yes gene_type:complete
VINNKNILITGGAGFIGTALCKKLVKNNKITVFDNLTRNSMKHTNLEKNKNIRFIIGDIRNINQIKEASKGMNIILHLAAIAGVSEYYSNPKRVIDVNYNGTSNLLNVIQGDKNIELFLDMSTSEIYGTNAHFVSEVDSPSSFPPNDMRSVYAKSKNLAEQLAFCYAQEYNLPVISVRPFNIYGPGQIGEGAISNMIQNAINNDDLFVTGDGSAVRAWCYIDDFIKAIIRLIDIRNDIKSEAYNIGNSSEVQTTLNLAKIIIRITKSQSKIKFVDHIGTEIPIRIPDTSKIVKTINFKPNVDLEMGIANTADWWIKLLK